MSTNSSVTIKHSDGKYYGVYGHWDGYFDGVGSMLHKHYNSQDRAEALVRLGDFSALYPSLDAQPDGTVSDFDTDSKHSIFYHRDRNENWEDVRPYIADTYEEAAKTQGYDYLWDGKEWLVFNDEAWSSGTKWCTIPEAIANDEQINTPSTLGV